MVAVSSELIMRQETVNTRARSASVLRLRCIRGPAIQRLCMAFIAFEVFFEGMCSGSIVGSIRVWEVEGDLLSCRYSLNPLSLLEFVVLEACRRH